MRPAALALAYDRSQDRLRRLTVLEERERIGRDLHDGVVQSLFAIGLTLQATSELVEEQRAVTGIEAAVGGLDRVIDELRGYIFQLHR